MPYPINVVEDRQAERRYFHEYERTRPLDFVSSGFLILAVLIALIAVIHGICLFCDSKAIADKAEADCAACLAETH